MIISARSAKFTAWLEKNLRTTPDDRKIIDLLVELEAAARLARHDWDTMGECAEVSIKRIVAVSETLQEAYEGE